MSERQNGSNTLLLAVAAGLAGATLALLFAPRSGTETRRKLQGQADEMKQRANENLLTARDALGSSIERASELQDKVASAIKTRHNGAKLGTDETDRTNNAKLSKWEEEQ